MILSVCSVGCIIKSRSVGRDSEEQSERAEALVALERNDTLLRSIKVVNFRLLNLHFLTRQ